MIKFTKSVATGNDFIIVESDALGPKGRARKSAEHIGSFAKKYCDRKYGIGADGVLVVDKSEKSDFKMRIFNPDGSEAEMCGNGSRCIALYAHMKKIAPEKMKIETLAGVINAQVRADNVKVKLTDPKDIRWNLCLMIHECPYKVDFANTGVPHVVHFVKDIENIGVKELGSKMRYHADFSPSGANVDFVSVDNREKNRIRVRTYERGVEDETLACGTGAVASAIISAEAEHLASPIEVQTRGGEILKVYFDEVEGNFRNIYLEGKAQLVYEGVIKDV
jgi:diaminopimelate epimerase